MEDAKNDINEQSELFGSINNSPDETSGSSKAGSLVVLGCCLLSIFFGGWLSLIIAAAVFTPFRKQSNGWIIFLGTYVVSNILLFLVMKSIF